MSKLEKGIRESVRVGVCDPSCSGSGMLDNFDARDDAKGTERGMMME